MSRKDSSKPTLQKIKGVFRDACEGMGFDIGFLVFEELGGIVIVKASKGKWIDPEYWNPLNEITQSQLGGYYSRPEKGWVIPSEQVKVPASKRSTSQTVFKKATDVRGTRTGLSKIDRKLEELDEEKISVGKIVLIERGRIKPNKYNLNEMTDEEFLALLENMRKEGLRGMDPILIRPFYNVFEIIDGAKRFKVAQVLKWPKLQCIIREMDEDRAKEINYAKNKFRGHINPFKEADLFYGFWRKLGTQKAVAEKFGVSQPYIVNTLVLRRIPEEIQRIIPQGIARSYLEVLARVEDPADQERLAEKIVQGITVREAREYAELVNKPPRKA